MHEEKVMNDPRIQALEQELGIIQSELESSEDKRSEIGEHIAALKWRKKDREIKLDRLADQIRKEAEDPSPPSTRKRYKRNRRAFELEWACAAFVRAMDRLSSRSDDGRVRRLDLMRHTRLSKEEIVEVIEHFKGTGAISVNAERNSSNLLLTYWITLRDKLDGVKELAYKEKLLDPDSDN